MGYNLTYSAFKRVKEHLDLLKHSTETVKWQVKNPKKFAYMIHNGMMAAQALKIPGYNHLKAGWEIKCRELLSTVIANPKQDDGAVSLALEGYDNAFAIVNKMIALKGTQDRVTFTEVVLDAVGRKMLANWCVNNGCNLQEGEGNIVITQEPAESRAESL